MIELKFRSSIKSGPVTVKILSVATRKINLHDASMAVKKHQGLLQYIEIVATE